MTRILLGGLLAVGVCVAAHADDPPQVDVGELVRQLGSEDFREREAASAKLAALPLAEPPKELLDALKSPDAEVRERAVRAVRAIRNASALHPLTRDERFAAKGQVDLYIASTSALKLKPDDERLWLPVFRLANRAVTSADMKGRRPCGAPADGENFASYRARLLSEFVRIDGAYARHEKTAAGDSLGASVALHAARVDAGRGYLSGLIVSRGEVTGNSLTHAVALANGNVTLKTILASVVVCDGDVVLEQANNSLIVARGKIDVRRPSGCALVSGGTVAVGELPAILLQPIEAPGGIPLRQKLLQSYLSQIEPFRVDVKEQDTNPLACITFFELARIGLGVTKADGAVTVSAVSPVSVCAAAGVKVGDVVLEAGGQKTADAEALRRALRDALAVGDVPVTIRRGAATLTVKLALPD
jgi:hypothetical protein